MLQEHERVRLDSIVQRMEREDEPEENIRFVVNDFKKKYDTQENQNTIIDGQERGFFGRVKDTVTRRLIEGGATVQKALEGEARGEQKKKRTFFQILGAGASTASNLAFDAIVGGVKAITPKKLEEKAKEVALSGLDAFLNTSVGRRVISVAQSGAELMNKIDANDPALGRDIRAVGGLAELGLDLVGGKLFVKGGKGVAKRTLDAAAPVASRATTGLEKGLAKQIAQEALDIVAPKLSIKDKKLALAAGRGETGGFGPFKTIELKPSAFDRQVAKSVEGIVSKSKNATDNIASVKNAIKQSDATIKESLKRFNAIFNENQLRKKLNLVKEQSRIVFGGDKTLENAYDAVIDEMIRSIETFNLSGLFKARQKFDGIIKQKFPNIFGSNPGDNVRKNAVFDVRRAVNEFVAETLPDEAVDLKAILKTESLQFKAIDNMADNVVRIVDTSFAERAVSALRKNIVVAGLTGGIVTAAALTGLVTNPILLSSLILTGVAKIGKDVITSKAVKRALIKVLRLLEDSGDVVEPAVREGMERIIRELPD